MGRRAEQPLYRWTPGTAKDTQHYKSSEKSKTTMRCYPMLEMLLSREGDNKCWRGWREKGNPCAQLGGNPKLIQSLWKTVWSFLKT